MYVSLQGRYYNTDPIKQRHKPLRKGHGDQDMDSTRK